MNICILNVCMGWDIDELLRWHRFCLDMKLNGWVPLLRKLWCLSHLGKVSTALDEGLSGLPQSQVGNLQDHGHLQEWEILEWLVLSLFRGTNSQGGESWIALETWNVREETEGQTSHFSPGFLSSCWCSCFGMFHSRYCLTTVPAGLGTRDGNRPWGPCHDVGALILFLFPAAHYGPKSLWPKLERERGSLHSVEEPLYPMF